MLLSFICCALQEVKLCSPDYKDTEADTAIKDFQERIKNYELAYETLDNKKDKYEQNTCTVYVSVLTLSLVLAGS